MDDTPGISEIAKTSAGHRSTLFIVFLVVFIDLLGFGIVLPLLPLYAVDFLTPLFPGAANRPFRGIVLGLLVSSFASLFIPAPGAPGFAAAGFSLIALLLAVRLLPETLRPGTEVRPRRWIDLGGLQAALRTPSVAILIFTFFLATFAFGSLESTLA